MQNAQFGAKAGGTSDALGRRTAISTTETAARPSYYVQTFGYNERDELTGATRGGSPYGWTRGYQYDPIGNRQRQDGEDPTVRTTHAEREETGDSSQETGGVGTYD